MRRAVFAVLSTITGLVVLLSFKTHSPAGTTRPAAISPDSHGAGGVGSGSSGRAGSGSGGSTAGVRTVTGDAVDTPYGPVQVQVMLSGRRITRIVAVQLPEGTARDQEIDNYAVPLLTQEAMSAQSANIDVVSGATYTSDGYAQSLQSALDKAGR